MMTNFWPSGLDLEDTSSPLEILESAKNEWAEQSNGLLNLVIQRAESTNGNHLLIVHAKHVPSNRTVTLFSVVHRPGAPYPAKIQPRDNELPDILKKTYYRAGIAALAGIGVSTGEQVTNKWVSDTPSEFRSHLKDVFNLGSVKSEVLSLVSADDSSVEAEETERDNEATDGERGNSES